MKSQLLTSAQKQLRFLALLGMLTGLALIRISNPASAGDAFFYPSCGAITGLPCLFCGMTRGLHELLLANLGRALYFNWLVFPLLGVLLLLGAVFVTELTLKKSVFHWARATQLTSRRLSFGAAILLLLWSLQVYLAVSQKKRELLNPEGPLYGLFVK